MGFHSLEGNMCGAVMRGAVALPRSKATLRPHKNVIKYELLPYHRFGQSKYGYLGQKYELEGPLRCRIRPSDGCEPSSTSRSAAKVGPEFSRLRWPLPRG